MEKLYSGAATFGLLEAKAGLIWNSFLGGIFILVAILIFYNYNKKPKVQSEIKEDKPQGPNWVALGFILFGAVLIGGSIYKYYMATHSETYAAMSGVQTVNNTVAGTLNQLQPIKIPLSGGSLIFTETEI